MNRGLMFSGGLEAWNELRVDNFNRNDISCEKVLGLNFRTTIFFDSHAQFKNN